MKRIRYKKTDKPNIVESIRYFANKNGTLFKVRLDTENLTYKILSVSEQRVISSTEKDNCKIPANKEILCRQAKRALKKIGIDFDIEIRNLEN